MEVSDEVFDSVFTPTAAYWRTSQHSQAPSTWDSSSLNPRNIVDSFDLPKTLTWRFEGVDFSGTRYFITPKFAIGKPPLRIDVFVPRYTSQPEQSRRILQSNLSVLYQGQDALKINITKHLLRVLEVWSNKDPKFEEKYSSLPFGSRVVVENISSSIHQMNVHLIPTYDIERQWLTLGQLQEQWALSLDTWPPAISVEYLSLYRQPHEAITLVQVPQLQGERLFVFKSLTRDIKYMYHELRMLMTMPKHEHILGKPKYIVTKRWKFGRKVGVCGFVIEYYPDGTLRDLFRNEAEALQVTTADRFRWAIQITSTLLSIQKSPLGYYPDLKPDNVILRRDSKHRNILLIDFEQRGAWYSWTPPEVSYIEFIEYISSAPSDIVSEDNIMEHVDLIKSWDPDWQSPTKVVKYNGATTSRGYSTAWSQLTIKERESAQVYMLGKLLWCIFESRSSINCGMSPDVLREDHSEHQFPRFIHTPEIVRSIIRSCTVGAVEWRGISRPIQICGDRLFLQNSRDLEVDDVDRSMKVQREATKWWRREIKWAVRSMNERLSEKGRMSRIQGDAWDETSANFVDQRPTLAEVQESLTRAAATMGE